jgi:hypothetical protein
MEISLNEPIFDLIKNISPEMNNENTEMKINIINANGSWYENEFINFINSFRSNYDEIEKEEYLEVIQDDIILEINKMNNIYLYCNSNNYKTNDYKLYKLIRKKDETVKELFDVDINIQLDEIKILEDEPDKWDNNPKRFKLIKEYNYKIDNDIIIIAKVIKDSIKNCMTMKKSGINKPENVHYEFSMKLLNKIDNIKIINGIVKIIQGLYLSKVVLTKKHQAEILDKYKNLVNIVNKFANPNEVNNEVILLTPKPVALKRTNLDNPDNYGVISILRGYTVTEKADGERILMYIDDKGDVYTIDSSKRVEGTGIKGNKDVLNSLIDCEFINCNKRIDGVKRHLFAAFDIYYLNGENLTALPLIHDKQKSRYAELLKVKKLLNTKDCNIDFIAKEHKTGKNILDENKKILTNHKKFPYEIDGLIFTPKALSVYAFYPAMPVEPKKDMTWANVLKWKPPEQNTIDFLIKTIENITKPDGRKYKKFGLFVLDKELLEDYRIDNVLNIRYKYLNLDRLNKYLESAEKDQFKLFVPNKYYNENDEFSILELDDKNEIRAENGDKIETNTIVEFRYDLNEKRWIPIRLREDKTRIYKKGINDKTANTTAVALDTWDTIHNMISMSMITGGEEIKNIDMKEDNILETDDIYYERKVPFNNISNGMLYYHMLIKSRLYNSPEIFKINNRPTRGTLLEMACGQAGDFNNWKFSKYSFVLGLDLVKSNIYTSKGSYARVFREHKKQLTYNNKTGKNFQLIDMAFVVGDCTKNLKTGEAAIDEPSNKLLKIIMNPVSKQQNLEIYERAIAGRGNEKFNAISCIFAIHYFFESNDKLEQFLNNVSDNLKTGGLFYATFMDGITVEKELEKSKKGIIEGRKTLDEYSIPVWAIIKKYKKEQFYNKKIDVFLELTQKLITEYLVNFEFLIKKAKEFKLELEDTELFSESYEKIKKDFENDNSNEIYRTKYNLYENWRIDEHKKSLEEFETNEISKRFSFLNRWVIFKKVV